MSQENVDVVLSQFAAVDAGDFRAADALMGDDVVLALHGDVTGISGLGAAGRREVGRYFREWFATFEPGYRFTIGDTLDWGECVFVEATHHGRGKISGAVVTMPSFWVFTVRDRRIVRLEAFPDRAQAVAAVRAPRG